MVAVIVCGIFNSGMLLGLLGGFVFGLIRARGAIVTALASDLVVVIRPDRRAVLA